jgi:hypothetical protein
VLTTFEHSVDCCRGELHQSPIQFDPARYGAMT